jgi:hypothetical protein
MARSFLIRGMICGVIAGLLAFLYAHTFGEPSVDGAIGVEDAIAKAAGEAPEPELVSRAVQSGWGLFTGVMVYAIAIGGLFSLLAAFAWGRLGRLGPRASAALLAAASFVAIYLVPFLKYPANPPSVGNPDTIQYRTALYFAMILISIVGMVVAVNLGRSLLRRWGVWYAALAGGAVFLVLVIVASWVMPGIDEVPRQFPASLLWEFRTNALAIQLIVWATLGLVFGELTARSMRAAPVSQSATARTRL